MPRRCTMPDPRSWSPRSGSAPTLPACRHFLKRRTPAGQPRAVRASECPTEPARAARLRKPAALRISTATARRPLESSRVTHLASQAYTGSPAPASTSAPGGGASDRRLGRRESRADGRPSLQKNAAVSRRTLDQRSRRVRQEPAPENTCPRPREPTASRPADPVKCAVLLSKSGSCPASPDLPLEKAHGQRPADPSSKQDCAQHRLARMPQPPSPVWRRGACHGANTKSLHAR